MWIRHRCWVEDPVRVRTFPPARRELAIHQVVIQWPDGRSTAVTPGQDWLIAAREAGVVLPTGCLGGSCGACEIEVNGRVVRACIATVPASRHGPLQVALASDPHW